MTILTIEFTSSHSPLFGVTEWTDSNYKTPLKLEIEDCEIEILLIKPMHFFGTKRKFSQNYYLNYKFIFKSPSSALINGINKLNKKDEEYAIEKIYDVYKKAHLTFEVLLRSVGKVENLISLGVASREEIFERPLVGISYSLDSKNRKSFFTQLKKSKKISPLYSSRQLLTFEKWKKIQEAANKKPDISSPEIDELYKIKSKIIFYDTRRFAVLEAIIIIEYALAKYTENHLVSIGWSNKKIKEYKTELTLNFMLNILLPSTLRKKSLKKIDRHISNINNLRKIRNAIMHEKLKDLEIDEIIAKQGIDSSIKLIRFLSKQ